MAKEDVNIAVLPLKEEKGLAFDSAIVLLVFCDGDFIDFEGFWY